VGSYWAPKGHPASSQGDHRNRVHSDQMVLAMIRPGEAGPVEHSSAEAKSPKLKAKGLSGFHPSGQQLRQPDGGSEGQLKNYSHDNSLKENRA
jgi:hypothetical protein